MLILKTSKPGRGAGADRKPEFPSEFGSEGSYRAVLRALRKARADEQETAMVKVSLEGPVALNRTAVRGSMSPSLGGHYRGNSVVSRFEIVPPDKSQDLSGGIFL